MIVIGGMIGLGKTTMAELISQKLNGAIYYESVDDNPILPLYYTASEKEIELKRYPFLLQLYFLNSRFKTVKEAAINSIQGLSVIDRSIYEDWYFANINKKLGRMSDLEFDIYEKLLSNMLEELATIPKKAPDLMIYLDGSFDTVIKRIKNRGRSYELDPSLIDYYKLLHSGYKKWLLEHYNSSPVLIINTDNLNIVDNINDQNKVIDLIKSKIKEIAWNRLILSKLKSHIPMFYRVWLFNLLCSFIFSALELFKVKVVFLKHTYKFILHINKIPPKYYVKYHTN